jgi:hypothetical protein
LTTPEASGELAAEAADRETHRIEILDQGLDFRFVDEQELDIVAARPPHVAVAVLVGDIAELTNRGDREQPRRGGANRKELIAGLRHVHHHTGLDDLVVVPLAVVLLDDLGQKLLVMRGSDVGLAFEYRHEFLPSYSTPSSKISSSKKM